MTLAILAFGMVVTFMTLIMTKRCSALVALILVPPGVALIGGFGPNVGAMMLHGVQAIAPTGVMLLFAILYFGVMIDAGLFNPLIRTILCVVHHDPLKILLGTMALALIVSLDGDGATTYMITISAMLPLYRRLQLDVRKMACVIIMASAIMNILPWGGPTARAAAALGLDPATVYIPLIPAMLVCVVWLFCVTVRFGLQERRRLEWSDGKGSPNLSITREMFEEDGKHDASALRPQLFWFNLVLTIMLMGALLSRIWPMPILFMIALAIALMVNYPSLADQKQRLAGHAGNAMAVAGLVFSAGIFIGILTGTKMVDAMAATVVGAIPPWLGPYLAPLTALVSIPFTFFISNDAFYFGILPILAQAGGAYGIPPEDIARASLVGQQVHLLSPLVPSTYLLVGMSNLEFGEHQRFTLPWALGAALLMLLSALLFGIFPLSS